MRKVPKHIQALEPEATFHRHINGGGWVSDSADIADSIYVHRKAAVFGGVIGWGNARIGESVWMRFKRWVRNLRQKHEPCCDSDFADSTQCRPSKNPKNSKNMTLTNRDLKETE